MTKRKKDPARPKRPITPFLYYACKRRKDLATDKEKLSLGGASKKIALEWNAMPFSDKQSYVELSMADRRRYDTEMLSYVPPKRIKRPRSAYAFFMQLNRTKIAAEYPEFSPRDLMVKIAEAWKRTDNRDIYKNKALEDKHRYETEKREITTNSTI